MPCPPCFDKSKGFFQPPECYNELTRCKVAQQYINLPHWNEAYIFKKIISKIRKEFGINGISISVIDRSKTLVKFEHLLGLVDIPRIASIDSHTILSQGYFLLLNASEDWRTQSNPFVNGIPHIKFYLGVPLTNKNGMNIGVLSIFDSFVRREFQTDKIRSFQLYAKEIMKILETPISIVQDKFSIYKPTQCETNSDNYADDIKKLAKKIGRATSKGEQMFNIFEKDGSGGPYSPNHTFRFKRNSEEYDVKSSQILFEKMLNAGNIKNGAAQLSKFIVSDLGIDFAYILEIRIAESYRIEKEYFPPKQKEIDVNKFTHASKLVKDTSKNAQNDCITRIIGYHGCNYTNLNIEDEIHSAAFSSEFGIHYQNLRQTSLHNDGILIPFFRHNSKLVRKHRVKKGNELSEGSNDDIDLYLRSGGYLIACYNEGIKPDSFNPEIISEIFEYATILRKIYLSS